MTGHIKTSGLEKRILIGIASVLLLGVLLAGCSSESVIAPPPPDKAQDCGLCHKSIMAQWQGGPHSASQLDVAGELAAERSGETPDEVLHGADAENCIACHGARAVTANGGMTEAEALAYFFTTEGGVFTGATEINHPTEWPHAECQTCHAVPGDHPAGLPELALFDSRVAASIPVDGGAELCGQCHGSIRFPEIDHLAFDAWTLSKKAATQDDVAMELAEERAGETPSEVVTGDDPENCIACHSPTAIRANGGMSEVAALDYFFTTNGDRFTDATAGKNTTEWPEVECVVCHDPHNPEGPSYFNSSTGQYEPMGSISELCGHCHGTLRFAGTDHLSYNIMQGTGGIGVPDELFMGERSCEECHMFASGEEETKSTMFRGHSFGITVTEDNGATTTSCTHCHPGMDTLTSNSIIAGYRSVYGSLLETATANVEAATVALAGSSDQALLDKLEQAQTNLDLAAGDESGGFHNHTYTQALLSDANARALEIVATR